MSIQDNPNNEIIDGIPGGGKSYLVLYKILQSFNLDRPCCYIDPKGETYWQLLAILYGTEWGRKVWQKLRHRIRFVNPVSMSDRIVGFNAIEPMGNFFDQHPDEIALVADIIVGHVLRQSNFELYDATRMQDIFKAGITLLLNGGAGKYTIAEVPKLFTVTYDRKKKVETFNPFVQQLLDSCDHYGTNAFWRGQWANWSGPAKREWTESTRDRISKFTFNNRMLYTTCAVKAATLNFREVVDKKYWLFVHIPFHSMGEIPATMLGNLIVTKLHYAAMQRQMEMSPYRIILDEAKFFNTGPLERILETSRRFELWLILVVQSLTQMCRSSSGGMDTRLRDSIIDNCRYFTVFNSTNDGEIYGRLMFPPTGTVVIGRRQSGDNEYLPVAAEQAQTAAMFNRLGKREVYVYDKLSGQPATKWRTPTVNVPKVPTEELQLFEAEHMIRTGRSALEIAFEIDQRQKLVDNIIYKQGRYSFEDKKAPPPPYEEEMV